MSGRAGRRGLDDKGVVILMLDTKMEPSLAKEMVKGAPDTLHSEFHLGYNMLLNMLRVEGANPEKMLRVSYRQFQMERSLPHLERKVQQLEVWANCRRCQGLLDIFLGFPCCDCQQCSKKKCSCLIIRNNRLHA